MLFRLLLLFVLVPFVELTLLLWLSEMTDWTYALGLIVVTGLVGTFLARSQGFRVYREIQSELAQGKLPGKSLADGAMILFAGGLLLTPGILTDIFGFSLLLPVCRAFYVRLLMARLRVQMFSATPGGQPDPFGDDDMAPQQGQGFPGELRQDRIIDSYVIESPMPDEPE